MDSEIQSVNLSDYNGGFPTTFYFHDIKDKKLKKMTVTEQAWNNTLKTFEDNNKVNPHVIIKYMSKHVKTQEV